MYKYYIQPILQLCYKVCFKEYIAMCNKSVSLYHIQKKKKLHYSYIIPLLHCQIWLVKWCWCFCNSSLIHINGVNKVLYNCWMVTFTVKRYLFSIFERRLQCQYVVQIRTKAVTLCLLAIETLLSNDGKLNCFLFFLEFIFIFK